MAILTLEDPTGSTQVILFPDVFTNFSPLLKSDEPLLVTGTAEVDENVAKIISQEIFTLENVRQNAIRAIELSLHKEITSRELLDGIKDIIFRYPGECPVLFRADFDQGKEVIIAAHDRYRVSPCNEMINAIETLTGKKVIRRYGKKNQNHRQAEYQ